MFDTQGNNLIVSHSYEGIYEVNLENGKKKLLVGRDEVIGEKVRNIFKSRNEFLKIQNVIFLESSSLQII